MTPNTPPPELPPRHPPITRRGLYATVALVAAFPAALFALEHPRTAATSLLLFGAVTAAITGE